MCIDCDQGGNDQKAFGSMGTGVAQSERKCDDCGSGELVTRFTIQTEDGEVLEEGWRCRGCHVMFGLACFGLGPDD